MKNEKAELARRLDAMKDTAKKAMEASGRRYAITPLPIIMSCSPAHACLSALSCRLDELETSFKSLKITSDESGLFVAQVRSSMADFKQERKDAADCFKSPYPLSAPRPAKKSLC